MAKTVASLSVSINARTKGLQRGLRNAKRQVQQFADEVKSVAARVAKLGAVGAVVATAGTAKAIQSLDKLAKTADKLSGIEPTALIALRDAAQESGVQVSTFDMGLQRMLRRIQEASQGRGEALNVLKDLRLDAQQLIRLAPEKQFEEIAKAMARSAQDGLDLSRAMKLFDSEGVALVNTLRLINKEGLGKFIKEVERSGRAVTRDQLKPIESVNDRLLRMGHRIAGMFQQVALALAGPLDKGLRRIENFLSNPANLKSFVDSWREIAKWIQNSDKHLNSFMEKLRNIVKHMSRILAAVGTVVGGGAAFVQGKFGSRTVERLENVMAGRPAESGAASGDVGFEFSDVIDRAREQLKDTPEVIKEAGEQLLEATKKFGEKINEGVTKAAEAVNEATKPKGQIFRLERSDGTPINMGGTSLESLKEQRKTNSHLQELLRKFPVGTERIMVAG